MIDTKTKYKDICDEIMLIKYTTLRDQVEHGQLDDATVQEYSDVWTEIKRRMKDGHDDPSQQALSDW